MSSATDAVISINRDVPEIMDLPGQLCDNDVLELCHRIGTETETLGEGMSAEYWNPIVRSLRTGYRQYIGSLDSRTIWAISANKRKASITTNGLLRYQYHYAEPTNRGPTRRCLPRYTRGGWVEDS